MKQWLASCLFVSSFCLVGLSGAAIAQEEGVQADFVLLNVARFEVEGNSLLPPEDVDRLMNRYVGRLSFGAINEAARKLQDLYRARGFGTVVVTVPPQQLKDQVLKILVVEGRLANVQTAGIDKFSEQNIERSLPSLRKGETVNFQDLDSQLLMINESPSKKVRVVFQPGVKPKEVDALVVVQERPVNNARISLDNTGTRSTGRDRLSLAYQHANLFDRDVVGDLRYTTSTSKPSQVSLFSGSIRAPLYGPQLFIEGFARYSNTENTPNQTPAGELSFAGKGRSVGLRVLRTLDSPSEIKQQVFLGAERRRFDNTCSLGNFGSAGCGSLGLDLNVQPVSVGYIAQKQGSFIASAQVIHNIASGSDGSQSRFDQIRQGAKANYTKMQINGEGISALESGVGLRWRVDSQLTADTLVASEQFGLGGAYGVRGYEERELAGDSGFSFSLEMSYGLSRWFELPAFLERTQIFGFIDGGVAVNKQNVACDANGSTCELWSGGGGLRLFPVDGLSAQLAIGVAGVDAIDTKKGDARAHANLMYEF